MHDDLGWGAPGLGDDLRWVGEATHDAQGCGGGPSPLGLLERDIRVELPGFLSFLTNNGKERHQIHCPPSLRRATSLLRKRPMMVRFGIIMMLFLFLDNLIVSSARINRDLVFHGSMPDVPWCIEVS